MFMWENKLKAVTFSYDDGVEQDIRLVGLLNKYKVKCTFNINSGLQTASSRWVIKNKTYPEGITIKRMNTKGMKELYAGHEIAAHGLTHASLPELDEETMYNEMWLDIRYHELIYGQEILGMAYSYGDYNDLAVKVLKDCNLKYARTVNPSHKFDMPEDLFRLKPTCHHDDPWIMDLIGSFLKEDAKEPRLFYIWGHSYELEANNNWEHMESILELLAGHDDIFYGTNKEVLL